MNKKKYSILFVSIFMIAVLNGQEYSRWNRPSVTWLTSQPIKSECIVAFPPIERDLLGLPEESIIINNSLGLYGGAWILYLTYRINNDTVAFKKYTRSVAALSKEPWTELPS